MAVPNKSELDKKVLELDKHLKKLLDPETGKQKEKALITMVRGAIRSSWAISPAKLAYFEMGRVADTDPSTATKWKMQCECCSEWFKTSEVEIDHCNGNHTFTEPNDFPDYFDNILDVTFKDLQRICKYKCHRIKSHMEKQGHPDMYTACLDKIIIFLIKHIPTTGVTKLLKDLGIAPESSAPKRKKQLAEWLGNLELSYEEASHFFETCDYLMRLSVKQKKAKRFKMTGNDLKHKVKWLGFWDKVGVFPEVTLALLEK